MDGGTMKEQVRVQSLTMRLVDVAYSLRKEMEDCLDPAPESGQPNADRPCQPKPIDEIMANINQAISHLEAAHTFFITEIKERL